MDLGWKLNNPAITLEKYYADVNTYAEKKSENLHSSDELRKKQYELQEQKNKLEELENDLSLMGTYKSEDIDGTIQNIQDSSKQMIITEQKKAVVRNAELCEKRNTGIRENDNWLKARLTQLFGDNAGKALTEAESKALEFEIARRKFISASNERITQFENLTSEEQLACQTELGELKRNQDEVYSHFEPQIEEYKSQIDDINNKYQPKIRSFEVIISEEEADMNDEINLLEEGKNREIQLANNQIDAYRRELVQSEKQLDEQIRIAKAQSKSTTRLESSKISRQNTINDKIQKTQNSANKKISGIDQKISEVQNKHGKKIDKAQSQLDTELGKRDQELAEPTEVYNGLIQKRDSQIASLQSKIDQRQNQSKSRISDLSGKIDAERQAQSDNNAKIDQQIVDYVMSGDNCFNDVLDEENAPFAALEGRIQKWMELLSSIKKDKLPSSYQREREKQKNNLMSKDYQELHQELSEASQYNDRLSIFAKNNSVLMIIGIALAVLGIALFAVIDIVLKQTVGMIGIALFVLGAATIVLTVIKTNKAFSSICKYVSLASDYHEFPALRSMSTEITINRELAKMKAMGDRCYNEQFGRAEAQKIHDAKDADIKADFERALKLSEKEFENRKAQIERDRDNEIRRVHQDAKEREARFNSEREDLEDKVNSSANRIEVLNACISDLEKTIRANTPFIDEFDKKYRELTEKLKNADWFTPMDYSHGKLSNVLYVIPENGETDEFNHKKIYKINHNKKAFVINYDLANVAQDRVEESNEIIIALMFDLMYSVYRMNSRDTYAQFVVDGMAATDKLQSQAARNSFNIIDITRKTEDLRGRFREFSRQREALSNKSSTIDSENERNYLSQDRPEKYNILYIIFRPDESRSRLDEELRSLIPECDKYGFLPIFICEKETWEREIQKKDSIYTEIKSLANTEIVVFDGKTYSIA